MFLFVVVSEDNMSYLSNVNCFKVLVLFIWFFMWQRKLEREYVMFGGAQPSSDSVPDENEEDGEEEEKTEPVASFAGTLLF